MRFAFTADQLELRDAARDLLQRECTPAVVRAAWTAEPGRLDRRVWDLLAEMGATSVLVPEPDGGLGLDFTSLVLVLEEAGRACLPHPLVETAAVAAPLVKGRVGRSLVACCFAGAPVPCGGDADLVLVDDGGALVMATRTQLLLEPVQAVDRSRRLVEVAAIADGVEVLTRDPAEVEAAFDRGALGVAAELIGLAAAMLERTVVYVGDRHQFGVPVGSFQAIKHHLADALMALEFARPAVYRAAVSVSTGAATAARDVSMAKAMASDAAEAVGRTALQCHGAIGYTVEYDLHLYLKRAWALARAYGDAAWHRDRVAAALAL